MIKITLLCRTTSVTMEEFVTIFQTLFELMPEAVINYKGEQITISALWHRLQLSNYDLETFLKIFL